PLSRHGLAELLVRPPTRAVQTEPHSDAAVAGYVHDFLEELLEYQPQLHVLPAPGVFFPFDVEQDVTYHRVPPIWPLSHRSPSARSASSSLSPCGSRRRRRVPFGPRSHTTTASGASWNRERSR